MIKSDKTLSAYLVDDELLALNRLGQLLESMPLVKVIGSTTNPESALKFLQKERVDVLFLDISMPVLNGFELLAQLSQQPMVIFTTAYDKYALKAFEVNSIDYLLKPVEPNRLEHALNKLLQFHDSAKAVEFQEKFQAFISQFMEQKSPARPDFSSRISFRVGDRILFVELDQVTHFYAEDKVTFAATSEAKKYIVDYTITELEEKLGHRGFVRIHRATLVNLSFIDELHRWFGGRLRIRLKNKNQTELTVARKQVKLLKEQLGL